MPWSGWPLLVLLLAGGIGTFLCGCFVWYTPSYDPVFLPCLCFTVGVSALFWLRCGWAWVRRERGWSWIIYAVLIILLPFGWRPAQHWLLRSARYRYVSDEIGVYRRGEPLDAFLARLQIEDAPYELFWSNWKPEENRIYHLDDFWLDVSVEVWEGRPPTISRPSRIQGDRRSPEERMRYLWEQLERGFEEKSRQLKAQKQ